MDVIFGIIRKDMRIFLHDRKAIMMSFLLPIAIATVIGFAVGGFGGGSNKIGLNLVNLDNSPLATDLIEELKSMGSLNVVLLDPAGFDRETTVVLITKGEVGAHLIIPKGWGAAHENLFISQENAPKLELLLDPARRISASALQGSLMPALGKTLAKGALSGENMLSTLREQKALLEQDTTLEPEVKTWLLAMYSAQESLVEKGLADAPEDQKDEPLAFFGNSDDDTDDAKDPLESVSSSVLESVVTVTKVERDKTSKINPFSYTFPGTAVMFLLFAVTEGALSLLNERRSGVFKKLAAAPVATWQVTLGKMGSLFIIGCLQLLAMFLFGVLVLKMSFNGSIAGFVLVCMLTVLGATSFGMVIATLGKSEKQLNSLSVFLILVMSAVGGSMFPFEIMPKMMQNLSWFTMNRWAILGMEGGIFRQLTLLEMAKPIAVLAGISALLFFTAIRRLKLIED